MRRRRRRKEWTTNLVADELEEVVDDLDLHERIDGRHLVRVGRRVGERRHPFGHDT
jgi:hypothetical protein